eukprot:9773679-Alexandrium_andersonii.AAC.1
MQNRATECANRGRQKPLVVSCLRFGRLPMSHAPPGGNRVPVRRRLPLNSIAGPPRLKRSCASLQCSGGERPAACTLAHPCAPT